MAVHAKSTASVWTPLGGLGERVFLPASAARPKTRPPAGGRGAVQASVVFDKERRVFCTRHGRVGPGFALDGVRLWQRQLTGSISASAAVDADGGRVFIGTHAGWVYALQSADGAVLWRRSLPSKNDARILSDLLYLPAQRAVVLSIGRAVPRVGCGLRETRNTWDAGVWPQSPPARMPREISTVCAPQTARAWCSSVSRQRTAKKPPASPPESRRGAQRMVVAAAPILDESRGVANFILNGDRTVNCTPGPFESNATCGSVICLARLWLHRGLPLMATSCSPPGRLAAHVGSGRGCCLSLPNRCRST